MLAIVEVRSQHAKRGRSGFRGPDTYVAVQIVPDGVRPLSRLDRRSCHKKGIRLVYFGEGYSQHRGPRSALGKALRAAEEYANEINMQALEGLENATPSNAKEAKLLQAVKEAI